MAHSMGIYGLFHLRARLAGEIEQLEGRNRARAMKIASIQVDIKATTTKIAELQTTIENATETGKAAFGVNLSSTVPRKTYPKKHFTSWGGLTRSILSELKVSRGVPLTAMELSRILNLGLHLELDPSDVHLLNRSVRDTLKALANKGLVSRVKHEDKSERSVSWVIRDTEE